MFIINFIFLSLFLRHLLLYALFNFSPSPSDIIDNIIISNFRLLNRLLQFFSQSFFYNLLGLRPFIRIFNILCTWQIGHWFGLTLHFQSTMYIRVLLAKIIYFNCIQILLEIIITLHYLLLILL